MRFSQSVDAISNQNRDVSIIGAKLANPSRKNNKKSKKMKKNVRNIPYYIRGYLFFLYFCPKIKWNTSDYAEKFSNS
jgi:hypothetical protein